MNIEEKFKQIYYSDTGFFIGKGAPKKLAELAKQSISDAEKWLSKQAIYQVYFPTVRRIHRPQFSIYVPNQAHQADLIFLPNDNGYKYALTVIDIASRFKAARPLKSKSSEQVAAAFSSIYSNKNLTFPQTLMTDPGKEFYGAVKSLMEKNGTKMRYGRVNLHRDQALVERFNRTLAERLFTYQTAQELKMSSGSYNREWVKRLPTVVETMNNEVTRSINTKPVDAIKLKVVKPVSSRLSSIDRSDVSRQEVEGASRPLSLEDRRFLREAPSSEESPGGAADAALPPYPSLPGYNAPEVITDEFVRYMYLPGESENDTRRRATDPRFSLDVHKVERRFHSDFNEDYYFLSREFNPKSPTRSFVRAELLVIPDETEIF